MDTTYNNEAVAARRPRRRRDQRDEEEKPLRKYNTPQEIIGQMALAATNTRSRFTTDPSMKCGACARPGYLDQDTQYPSGKMYPNCQRCVNSCERANIDGATTKNSNLLLRNLRFLEQNRPYLEGAESAGINDTNKN